MRGFHEQRRDAKLGALEKVGCRQAVCAPRAAVARAEQRRCRARARLSLGAPMAFQAVQEFKDRVGVAGGKRRGLDWLGCCG